MAKNVLNETFSEPLNSATTARVEIHAGDGNLTVDRLTGGEPVLASGTLQYLEKQDRPTCTLDSSNGQAVLRLKGSRAGQPWFHFPWSACNGATNWQIHLNPTVRSDISAHSDGGNIKLDLANSAVTRLSTDTGGGNIDVILPDHSTNLSVTAKTGAGNVTVAFGDDLHGSNFVETSSGAGNVILHLPDGVAARIHATTGMGVAIVDSRFTRVGSSTYESPDFDRAPDKIEITAKSGAGNVNVATK